MTEQERTADSVPLSAEREMTQQLYISSIIKQFAIARSADAAN